MTELREETYRLRREEEMLSPQLMFYPEIIDRNIQRMIGLAGSAGRLWPHIKTHKCAAVVEMLMARGIRRFKAATIAEAEMCGRCGADAVILAYPLVGPNRDRFLRLTDAFPGTEFFAIGDDLGQVRLLGGMAATAGKTVPFLADINDGMNRTGVAAGKAEGFCRAAAELPGIRFRGLHVYDGQRHEADPEERRKRVEEDLEAVNALRDALREDGIDAGIVVMGGTPSFPCHVKDPTVYCSPGTCVVQDRGYAESYPDLPFEIGAVLLTRVVSHPAERCFTLDLGAKAVATDPAIPRAVVIGYEEAETVMQSEEHWVLRLPAGCGKEVPALGRAMYAVPKHICPTSALYPSVPAIRDGEVVDEWEITARNRRLTI